VKGLVFGVGGGVETHVKSGYINAFEIALAVAERSENRGFNGCNLIKKTLCQNHVN
jgi:hypothetical protein